MDSNNQDMSSFRIEKELIDGKYYYSIMGVPKELINTIREINNGRLFYANISVTNDDPTWIIRCNVTDSLTRPLFRSAQLLLEEPFKVKLKNGSKLYEGTTFNLFHDWLDEEDGVHCCLKNFAIGYPKKAQIRLEDVHPSVLDLNVDETCFVYIMRNNKNGAYKIGISNNPKYREHTLQSQEPDVSCIFQLEFPSRERARIVEREMHLKYAEYHMRGEWFAIPHDAINQVMIDIVKCSNY